MCVSTTAWMHHMDAYKTHEEKVRWQLHKNATSCFEQVLETTLHKTAAVQPLTSHFKNHPSKTNKTWEIFLEKPWWTHEWRSFMDPYTLHKTAAVWPLTSHFRNHPSKTNKTWEILQEKQWWTHEWRSSMDPYTWMCQCWPTRKTLFMSSLCRHWMKFEGTDGYDGW